MIDAIGTERMTKEEAKRIAQGLITAFKCESQTMVEFCNVIIEALEQETILDNIKTKIEQKIVRRSGLNHTRTERDRNDAFLEVLDIIKKCSGEQEDENGN